MNENNHSFMTRRQLIQTAGASAVYLALPNIAGYAAANNYKGLSADEGKALELINCNIIDVRKGVVAPGRTITIRRGLIENISGKIPSAREDALIIDMKNQYLIPGLIDAHCHSTLSAEAALNPFGILTTMKQIKRNYVQQLTHGVTTIRDMGAMPGLLHDNLAMIAKKELAGPRVVHCNSFTNIKGGHPDIDPDDISIFSGITMAFTGNPNLWFKNTAELREKMKVNSSGGASFIKLTMDNKSVLCGKGDIPVYTDEQLKVIFEFARENNLAVAGHIHSKFGFDRALQYGINSMEHTIADAALTDKEVSAMARKNIAIVPTIIIAQMLAAEEAYVELPKEFRTNFIKNELAIRRQYLQSALDDFIESSIHESNMAALGNFQKYGCENMYKNGKFMARPDIYFNILLRGPKNILKMKNAGVVIGCGTDSGVPLQYHGSLYREMEMLNRIGFSNKEVLRCATINNAAILKMADKIGSIEKGKYADIVVLKENPLEKIAACRAPQMVIKDGCIYETTIKT
jgi:imidazolonepropionase-like amidohydrolase